MTIQNVDSKRSTFLTKVADYKTALESGTQTDIDNALDAANQAGRDYAFEVGNTSTEEGITKDQLFSRADLYDESRRAVIDMAWGFVVKWTSLTLNENFPFFGDNTTRRQFAVDESRLYMSLNDSPYLAVYNLSDWSQVDGTPTLDGPTTEIVVHGGDVFITHGQGGYLSIFDKETWQEYSGVPANSNSTFRSLHVDDNYLYIRDWGEVGLSIYNRGDWTFITNIDDLPNEPKCVDSDESYLYIAVWDDVDGRGFRVYNKSDWSLVTAAPSVGENTGQFCLDKSYIYATGYNEYGDMFVVIDKSDWSIRFGTDQTKHYADAITQDDFYVYVSTRSSPRFFVVDKSDWSVTENPSPLTYSNTIRPMVSTPRFLIQGLQEHTDGNGAEIVALNKGV